MDKHSTLQGMLVSDAETKQTLQSQTVYIHISSYYAKCVQVSTSGGVAPGWHRKPINMCNTALKLTV